MRDFRSHRQAIHCWAGLWQQKPYILVYVTCIYLTAALVLSMPWWIIIIVFVVVVVFFFLVFVASYTIYFHHFSQSLELLNVINECNIFWNELFLSYGMAAIAFIVNGQNLMRRNIFISIQPKKSSLCMWICGFRFLFILHSGFLFQL